MEQVDLPFLEPADGSLRERLRTDARRLRDDLATPIVPAMIATIIEGAQREGPYRDRRDRVVTTAVANMRAAVDRAVVVGELAGAPDAETLVDQLLGAILFRRLIADQPATDEFIDHIVDAALAPWRPAPVLPEPTPRLQEAQGVGAAASGRAISTTSGARGRARRRS